MIAAPNMGRRQLPRLQLLDELRPFVLNAETSTMPRTRPGRVYALSSGMMTPKTLSNIFAQRIVDQARHSIFFVGYADPESPAGILRNVRPNEQVKIDPDRHCKACVVTSSSSNLARTRRVNRWLRLPGGSLRKKFCSFTAIRWQSNGCGRD